MRISRFKNEKMIFMTGFGLKIFAGLAMGYLYINYFEGGDSQLYFSEAEKIERVCKTSDINALEFLFHTTKSNEVYSSLIFSDQPRALFFTKIVYVFYRLSGGSFWLISVYLSTLSFAGFWIFYKTTKDNLSIAKPVLAASLFFWPSVVFWSSGLIKESISLPLILVLISLVLLLLKNKKYWPWLIAGFLGAAYLLFKIKYYYAAVLVPVLVSYYVCEKMKNVSEEINRKKYLQGGLFVLIFTLLTLVVSNLHYNLRFENVARVIVDNYHLFEAKSDPEKMVTLERFSPDLASFLYNMPKAWFSGLFRPALFDIENIWSALAGLENFALLILAGLQLFNIRKIDNRNFLLVFSAFVYCSLMATLLTFSSPNLGTLVRYKAGFLFVFILLILSNNPVWKLLKQKRKNAASESRP